MAVCVGVRVPKWSRMKYGRIIQWSSTVWHYTSLCQTYLILWSFLCAHFFFGDSFFPAGYHVYNYCFSIQISLCTVYTVFHSKSHLMRFIGWNRMRIKKRAKNARHSQTIHKYPWFCSLLILCVFLPLLAPLKLCVHKPCMYAECKSVDFLVFYALFRCSVCFYYSKDNICVYHVWSIFAACTKI